MEMLKTKFFRTLERDFSLSEFEQWLESLEDADELKKERTWREFFAFNYAKNSSDYEFANLLEHFDITEYARYKFENSLKQILGHGNLFRILKACNDFGNRHDFSLFRTLGQYDEELVGNHASYHLIRSEVGALAQLLLTQWNALPDIRAKLAFLKGEIPIQAEPANTAASSYERYGGLWWKSWKN